MSKYDSYNSKPDNLVSCNSPTFYSQVDLVALYEPDLYIFLTFASIGCIFNLVVIGLNLKNPLMRQRPGDLFFGLAIAEFMLSAHWLISALYQYTNNDKAVAHEDTFCQLNAFFSIIAGQFEFFYNTCIYIYVICAVRNFRIIKIIQSWHIHLSIIVLSLINTIGMQIFGYVGKTMFGTCSIRSENNFPIKGISLLVVFIFMSLSTLMYLNYKLPRIPKYQKLLKFYKMYMYSCILIWSALMICQIMVYLNCRYIHVHNVNLFITIGNICKVITTVVLPIIRITDPNIRLILRQMFKITKKLSSKSQTKPQQLNTNNSQNTSSDIGNNSMIRNIQSNLISDRSITNQDNTPSNIKSTNIEMVDFSQSNSRTGVQQQQQLQQQQSQYNQMSYLEHEYIPEIVNLGDYQMDNTELEKNISRQLFADNPDQMVSPDFRSRVSSYYDSARSSVDFSGNYYETLNNSQRESILYRMLSGIILSDRRKYKIFKIDIQSIRGESIYDQKKIYTLDDKLILDELSGIPKKCLELQQFDNIKMTSYCPLLFQSLIERDKVNIEKSLDLIANKNDIITAARESNNLNERRSSVYSRGTFASQKDLSSQKSQKKVNINGDQNNYMTLMDDAKQKDQRIDDYVFFSNDKQLFMKTINKIQLKYLLEIIQDYYNHIKQNPQSLLMKIYGIYQFKGLDNQELCIIIMKNIAPCPSCFIKRKYDLKGCTYKRKVLASYPIPEQNQDQDQSSRGIKSALSSDIYQNENNTSNIKYPVQVSEEIDNFYSTLLLKDIDFMSLENGMFISEQNKEGLLQVLERDILFLQRNGLINYSLMIQKVDVEKYKQSIMSEDPKFQSNIPYFFKSQMNRNDELPINNLTLSLNKTSIDNSIMNTSQLINKSNYSSSYNNINKDKSFSFNQDQQLSRISNQNNQNSNQNSISQFSLGNYNNNNTPFVASALESESEQGVFYTIGIIDFLHKYTLSKIIAKYSKIVNTMNSKLDQSTTNPTVYSQRFLDFCKKIINLPQQKKPHETQYDKKDN